MTETHFYEFVGKKGQLYKLNANCPASEKSGTGPGSCGGKTDDEDDYDQELKKTFTSSPGIMGKLLGSSSPKMKEINPKTLSNMSSSDLDRLQRLVSKSSEYNPKDANSMGAKNSIIIAKEQAKRGTPQTYTKIDHTGFDIVGDLERQKEKEKNEHEELREFASSRSGKKETSSSQPSRKKLFGGGKLIH